MNKDFIIFFREKRIDIEALQKSRKAFCDELEQTFVQLGPHSFDQQKKFIFNPLRLDFPLDIPIEESLKAKKGNVLSKKKIPLPNKDISGAGTETKTRKAPPLKRPLMKKTEEGASGKAPKKAPPLKRPIMKRNTDGKSADEKRKAPPLKRPIMKRNTEEKGNPEERPKAPPLKRPIMKRKKEGEEEKKKPPLKKPIMKPRKPKD